MVLTSASVCKEEGEGDQMSQTFKMRDVLDREWGEGGGGGVNLYPVNEYVFVQSTIPY